MSWTNSSVTIPNVAEGADVPVSTLARVLNDRHGVAPETYQKVRAIIDELGYDLVVCTDGVIVVRPAATGLPAALPVVVVDPNVETRSCPALVATNGDRVLSAMECLISPSHRKTNFINGQSDLWTPCAVLKTARTATLASSDWSAMGVL